MSTAGMTAAVLDITGLSKAFGGLQANQAIDLSLAAGELHAVIGPNGAGKSTLLSLLSGEAKVDAGSIRFLGQDITKWGTAKRARKGLARSYQITSLFPQFTAQENASLALAAQRPGWAPGVWHPLAKDRALQEGAKALLARVGLAGLAEVPVKALAHGQQRQLEIALALAGRPKALLLDEPLAGMAREESRGMVELLDSLKEDCAILLIEHDMDAVFALADRVTVLVSGKVLASGSPDSVRADPQVMRAYLGGG